MKSKILKEINGIVYKRDEERLLLILPQELVNQVLQQYHDHAIGGHRLRDRLYETLRARFFWVGMYTDVKNYVNSCELCLKVKTRAPVSNGLLRPIETKKPSMKLFHILISRFENNFWSVSIILIIST